jgi:Cu(I)/Ag(I) efflux system membrane protein CusA/SilA
MKPLATPVLGGMVSSLLHVLVVTPVIFFWLHERRLGLQREPLPATASTRTRWQPAVAAVALVALLVAGTVMWRRAHQSAGPENGTTAGQVVQRLRSGDLQIVLVSPTGTLHQGRNAFSFEFRDANGRLVDVGTVRVSGNMPMPGMVMSSGLQVRRTAVAGRYDATAEFGMAGAWHMAVEWDGPAGHGSINFEGAVQ